MVQVRAKAEIDETLVDRLNADAKAAMKDFRATMKDKDRLRFSTIVRVLEELRRRNSVPDDDDALQVLTRLVKQCRDAAAQYDIVGRADLAQEEKDRMEILSSYLTKTFSKKEITDIVKA